MSKIQKAIVANPEFAEQPHMETGDGYTLACWCPSFDRNHSFDEWVAAQEQSA